MPTRSVVVRTLLLGFLSSLGQAQTAPTVSYTNPSSGPVGTSVTIAGQYFGATQGSSTVSFNGTQATPTSWSDTQIVAPVPAGATTGTVSVTVNGVVSNGGYGPTFTVGTPPTVSYTNPSSGPVGTSVTITGQYFGATQGTSTVSFNGTQATPTSWSDSQIVAPVPSGATTGTVSVTVNGIISNGGYGPTFIVGTPPNVSYTNPASGPVGTVVTITGQYFGATQGSSTVSFNGPQATPTSWSDGQIVAPVPSGATTGKVSVTVNGIVSNGGYGPTFTVGTPPNVSYTSPASGPVGTSVTITGQYFGATQGSSTVSFNGTQATPTSWSDGQIVAPVPSGATTGTVSVTVNGIVSNGGYGPTFTVGTPPNVSYTNPSSGPVGTSVTITGQYFGATQGSSTVSFNGTQATPTSWSDTQIVAPVPSGATTGKVSATVSGIVSNGGYGPTFTVGTLPNVSYTSPASGPLGTSVTITGQYFGATQGSSTVSFNGTQATPASWSDGQIVAPVPSGATTGKVSVTVNGIVSNGGYGPTFTVITPPSITGLTPASGQIGSLVTISGSNFGATPGSVTFNGAPATQINSWSDTSINATVPSGATSGTVVVTAGGVQSNGVAFAVAGVLSGSFAPTVTAVTLTSPLASDWQHWGTSDSLPVVSNGIVSPILNGFTVIGGNAPIRFADGEIEFSWTDGDLLASADRTTTGVSVTGTGNGFHLSVPADTSPQTLILYVGAWEAQGQLTASLSDNSAPTFTDTSVDIVASNGDHHANGTYTLSFLASQSGQTLSIDYIMAVDHGAANGLAGTVSLQSAVLMPTQPSVLLSSPTNNQTFSVPSAVSLAANASQIGAAISTVSFFSDAQKFIDLNSAPYAASLTGLAPGDHTITATATDANGLTTTAAPVLIAEVGTGGVLTASADVPVSVDLSAGTSDWAHWSNATSDRKAGVTPQISGLKTLANGSAHPFDASPLGGVSYSWSSGKPTDSQAGTASQMRMQAYENGFRLTVAADTTLRTLKLYTASGFGESTLRASLSDGSATPFVNAFSTPVSFVERVYTIQFQAASPGQTLIITDQVTRDDGFAYVALESASVADQNPPHIDSVSAASGKPGDQITITGVNFGSSQGSSSVSVNGESMNVVSWSDSAITAAVPLVESGAVVVSRDLANSNGVAFTVVLPPPPAISFISPGAGATGTTISVFGTNFGGAQNNSTVTFNGLLASPTSWSDTVISVPAPSGVHSGPVVVTTVSGSSNGVQFTLAPGIRSSLQSVYVTPDETSVTVEGTVTFKLVDSSGSAVADAAWTVDNSALATITADASTPSKGVLKALAPGEVTVTATSTLGTARAKATIYAVGSIPTGTAAWSFYPQTQNYSFPATIKAFANSKIPDTPFMYLPEGNFVDTTAVNALDESGRLLWRVKLNPITPTNTIFFPVVASGTNDGGILVQTNEADPNGPGEATGFYHIGPDGKQLWTYSVPTVTTLNPSIGPDGTIYFWAQFTDSGTQLIALDDATGTEKFRFTNNAFSPTTYVSSEQPSDIRPDGIKVDATHPWMPCADFFPPGEFNPPSPSLGVDLTFQPIVGLDGSAYFAQNTSSSSVNYDKCTVVQDPNTPPGNPPSYLLNSMSGQFQWNTSANLVRVMPSGQITTIPLGSVSYSGLGAMSSSGIEFFQWTFTPQLSSIGIDGVVPHPDGGVLVTWGQGTQGASNFFLTSVQNDSLVATSPLPSSVFGNMATNTQGTVFFDNRGTTVTAVDIASGNPKWSVPGSLFAATEDGGALIKNAGLLQSVDQNGILGSESLPVGTFASYMSEGAVAVTQSGVGGSEQIIRTTSPQLQSFLSSPWAVPAVGDPSSTYSGNVYSKLVTIIGWINGKAITTPPSSSVNLSLRLQLSEPELCLKALLNLRLGNRSLIQSDIDRQYANAFLLTHSANNEPPPDLSRTTLFGSTVAEHGDYRGYNEVRVSLFTQVNQISFWRLITSKAISGDTPDACNSTLTFLGNLVTRGKLQRSEAHPDNGTALVTLPSRLHFFHLNEGRVGPEAQAVNMTLNACTSKDQDGLCNAPVPPVTPWIWSFPLFDATGAYTVNTQIFPTYYIYEGGKLVNKVSQAPAENFLSLNATSQVQAKDIQ